jgi:glycosyltransferase involved in cell wall biosynthesis
MAHICLITEGLTSFEQKGGVATWARELIVSLPDYLFSWINFSSTRSTSVPSSIPNLLSEKSIFISSYPLEMAQISHELDFLQLPVCDLYHASSTGCASLLGISLSQKHNVPMVLSEHAIYWKELQDTHELECGLSLPEDYVSVFREIAQRAYHHASIITSPVGFLRDLQVREGADPDKCRIVPNGLAPSPVQPKKRSSFCVGFVGRVTRIKNLELWLLIASALHQIDPSICFKVIGPSEDRYYKMILQQSVREYGLSDCFDFLPAMDFISWREEIDVLLLTSHMESQPYVCLEAFSSGIPVFARDVGGISETVGSAGFTFSPFDSADNIAQELFSIFKDSMVLEDYRKKAWQFFQNRYHISYMRNEFESIYHQGLGLNGKR